VAGSASDTKDLRLAGTWWATRYGTRMKMSEWRAAKNAQSLAR